MKIDFLNIPLDAITMEETIDHIDKAIESKQRITHVAINAGKVVMMQKDTELFKSVVTCDIINADGQSIVWATRFLGKKIPERVAGIDLMEQLISLSYKKKYKCFFLGAREEVVKKVVETYRQKFGDEIIAGYRNGFFNEDEELVIAHQIENSDAQLLFVAISSPKKENFLYKYKNELKNVNFKMGVGGSFDIIAGETKRAPEWMQHSGLEWLFRFLQEPKRMWYRYLTGNLKFIWLIIKEKLKGDKKRKK